MKMNTNNKEASNYSIKITEDIAYFIGVLHSDGYIYIFNDKKRNRRQIRIGLEISIKSITIGLKFKNILLNYFGKSVNLRQRPNKTMLNLQTSINKFWNIFENWSNGKIPEGIKNDKVLFGAYLAGLIDGDGYIQIKNNLKDRVVPQCVIRIASDCPLEDVKRLIENHIKCSVHFEFDRKSKGVNTSFYVSKKSIGFVKNYIYPHLVMPHKLHSLERFFNMKNEPAGIRTPISALIIERQDQPVRSRSHYPLCYRPKNI